MIVSKPSHRTGAFRMAPLFAAIEAGGTKFVCGVGTAEGSVATARIDTNAPDTTIAEILHFFGEAQRLHGPVSGLGIGSFGPLDLEETSTGYGSITRTPKTAWQGFPLLDVLSRALQVPAAISTDVNTAALAEATMGAGRGASSVAYCTIGTGIGVGFVTDGMISAHARQAEAGHFLVRRHPAHDGFAGVCPFHADCLEGLASGPAISAAWGGSLDTLPAAHPAWEVQADYLGQLCAALVLIVAPDVIVLGGGVMQQESLFASTRDATAQALAGYIGRWNSIAEIEKLIVPSACAFAPGLMGAYIIAEQAWRKA
jgi:fructokinase